jgi:hypothetical protein
MRDAIEIASEAGFTDGELSFMGDNFRRFEALVRADEREACAKVAENLPPVGHHRQLERATLKDAASAIRARGQA